MMEAEPEEVVPELPHIYQVRKGSGLCPPGSRVAGEEGSDTPNDPGVNTAGCRLVAERSEPMVVTVPQGAESLQELIPEGAISAVDVEEVTPTKQDQRAIARAQEPKWKVKRKLRDSPRKEVEKLIKEVDHSICGPPCAVLPTPPEIE
eukprot:RCo022655